MTTNEGENRPTQLSPKEFVRTIRGLYARTPHNVLSPFESLTLEEREEQYAALQRRIGGEYGERLRIKTQEVLATAPYLSHPLRVFIEWELDSDFVLGVVDKIGDQPLPEHYKGLYEVLTEKLPLVEELESDDEILKQLEITCYRVKLAHHIAEKENFEERTKKRIPKPPDDLIQIISKAMEKQEKDLGEWRAFILERLEENPEQPTQPPEQAPLI